MASILLRLGLLAGLLLGLLLGPLAALAQAPPPVPALPDTERRTTYTLSGTTCACSIGFALYGDSTDYQDWIEVWINGVNIPFSSPSSGWTLTSPTGPLAAIPRPITDAILTFNTAQTGTVQIVGARRPRRISQFTENRGVAARDLNVAITDLVAQSRETWDKINDISGRALLTVPGQQILLAASQTARAGFGACYDSNGNFTYCASVSTGPANTFAAGSGITFTGSNPTVISASGSGSQWVSSGSNISFTGGSVGINTASPAGNSLAVNGITNDANLTLQGSWSSITWGNGGLGLNVAFGTLTDTTSSTGTYANETTNIINPVTIAATNTGVIWTNAYNLYVYRQVAGANTTFTNNWAIGADNINILPPGASRVPGLVITQSGAGTTSAATGVNGSGFAYNLVNVTSDKIGQTGTSPQTYGMQVYTQPDTGSTGEKVAFAAFINRIGAAGDSLKDTIAGNFVAQTNVPNNGTNLTSGANGTLFALSPGATLSSGATNYFLVSGGEADVAIQTGASSRYRFGWSVVDTGNLQAADPIYDAAFEIGNATGAGFKNGLLFSQVHGRNPVSGCLICTDGVAATVTTGIDFSAYTITGNFLKGPGGFSVTGAGVISGTWGGSAICPPSYYCVSLYGSLAAAITAANSAGGGTVWLDSSVTLVAAQAVPTNVNIICANKDHVFLQTASATNDILDVTGNFVTIAHCGFAYTGGGTKTAGFFVDLHADGLTLEDFVMEAPFIGVHINATSATIRDGFFYAVTPTTGGAILCDAAGAVSISGVVLEGTGGTFPSFGLKMTGTAGIGCALSVSNSAFLNAANALWMAPAAGQVAFLHMTSTFLDTSTAAAVLQPNGGTIGFATFAGVEFGSKGGNGITIDTSTLGGNILQVTVADSVAYNYTDATANGINILGTVGQVSVGSSSFGKTGQRFANGFNLNAGASCRCQIIGNNFLGSSDSITLGAITTTSQIMFNNLNGGASAAGGNAAANFANNLP